MLLHAAVELGRQRVDGGIHVGLGGVGVDLVATQQHGGFGLVAQMFDSQHAMDVDQLFVVSGNAFELLEDVATHGFSYFHMMAG